MEFTKEQIETAKKILESYRVVQNRHHNFENYLDSLLKPETKKIIVEIESNDCDSIGILNRIFCGEKGLCDFTFENKWRATELPEVFTREDMIEFAKIDHVRYCDIEPNLEKFISERKSK